jgi:putative ABC transport system permease protein
MSPLATRNLFHDKIRLAVTLTGIVFAVVLIVVELGLYVGFRARTSLLIDNSEADLWVTSPHIPFFEVAVPFNESSLYRVKATPGVAGTVKYIVRAGHLSRPDGVQQQIQVVGFDPSGGMGVPWNVVEGSVENVKTADGVIIDESYKKQLGMYQIGDLAEINGHRARVVAFTRGVRSFAPAPYAFTSFENALNYAGLRKSQTSFLLVKIVPGANVEMVRRNILARLKEVDVLTTPEFSHRTQDYWTLATGAGLAILLAAALGMIVGFVVVAQTIYATTLDHLKEFGTLKAMGASNSYVYKVILKQASISALMGYTLGIIISSVLVHVAKPAGAPVLMNSSIVLGTFLLTLFICTGAALISINKVTRLDPAAVFKG